MSKGYRVKVNGVYDDEVVGWCGWEEIGFVVLDYCEHYFSEREKGNPLFMAAGGKYVCKECSLKYTNGPEKVSTGK